MNPAECFYLNVSLGIGNSADIAGVLAFFVSTNFAMGFLFGSAMPLLGSSFEWKKILKLPVKIICLF